MQLQRPTRRAHAKRHAEDDTSEEHKLLINEMNNFYRILGTCWRLFSLPNGEKGHDPLLLLGTRAPNRAEQNTELTAVVLYNGAFTSHKHDTDDLLAGPLSSKVRVQGAIPQGAIPRLSHPRIVPPAPLAVVVLHHKRGCAHAVAHGVQPLPCRARLCVR